MYPFEQAKLIRLFLYPIAPLHGLFPFAQQALPSPRAAYFPIAQQALPRPYAAMPLHAGAILRGKLQNLLAIEPEIK